MRIIVCGTTQVGISAARYLNQIKTNDLVVIGDDEQRMRHLLATEDLQGVIGHPADPVLLERAGAAKAEIVIAATANDETNLVICQLARNVFNVTNLVAKVSNSSYLDQRWRAGVGFGEKTNLVVECLLHSERSIAEMIANLAIAPGCVLNLSIAGGKANLVGFPVLAGSAAVDSPIDRLGEVGEVASALVVAVERNRKRLSFAHNDRLEKGDVAYVMVAHRDLQALASTFGHRSLDEAKNMIIVGGGPVGIEIAEAFEEIKTDQSIRLIEMDHRRAVEASERLRGSIVIDGDALNHDILRESGADTAEIFVAATESDQTNLLSALSAHQFGARQVMALVSNTHQYYQDFGIDVFIDPQEIAVSKILPVVRRGPVHQCQIVSRINAEIMECEVMPTSSVAKQPLSSFFSRVDDCRVGAIVRRGEIIPPPLDQPLEVGDLVIMVVDSQNVHLAEQPFAVGIDYL